MPRLEHVTRKWLRDRYTAYVYLTPDKVNAQACPRCRMPAGKDCEMGIREVSGVRAHPLRMFAVLDGVSYAQAVQEEEANDTTE